MTGKTGMHLWLILAGLACFLVAAFAALLYLFQSSQLKSKQPGRWFLKLPSLDSLDRMHFRWLAAGVALFSLGIVSGYFSATDPRILHAVMRDPKVDVALGACALYWVILGFRLFSLGRGQKIAVSTLLVLALLVTLSTALNSAPSGFHGVER